MRTPYGAIWGNSAQFKALFYQSCKKEQQAIDDNSFQMVTQFLHKSCFILLKSITELAEQTRMIFVTALAGHINIYYAEEDSNHQNLYNTTFLIHVYSYFTERFQ